MRLRERLESLKGKKFTGRIDVTKPNGKGWRLYLFLGRFVWADGGLHPYRAWQRLIRLYCPDLDYQLLDFQKAKQYECWNYYLIVSLLQRFLITKKQAIFIINERIKEIIFDIIQAEFSENLLYDLVIIEDNFSEESGLRNSINLFKIETIFEPVESDWQQWQRDKIAIWSPAKAPIIKNPAILRQQFNEKTYQKIVSLFDGKYPLREIADKLRLDLIKVIIWLKPYFQMGLIELVEVQDQSLKINLIGVTNTNYKITKTTQQKLILCIDDSLQICQIMEHIITKDGYQFISVQNPLKALPEILKTKPDLIFLDLIMPVINGYEICAQIRRVSQLKDTPVIILTGNDGVIDRVRSKMVGASGFLSKPVDEEKVLEKIDYYLRL